MIFVLLFKQNPKGRNWTVRKYQAVKTARISTLRDITLELTINDPKCIDTAVYQCTVMYSHERYIMYTLIDVDGIRYVDRHFIVKKI